MFSPQRSKYMRMAIPCATPFGGVADASRDWPVGENVPLAVPQPFVDQRTEEGITVPLNPHMMYVVMG